jgi:hypothetical protein
VEKYFRTKNTQRMTSECIAAQYDFQVLLVGPPIECSEDLSETLLTMIQHAKSPQALRITVIEAVESLERESTTILMYKNKAIARGLYTETFLDKVRVIQVLQGSPMFNEASALMPTDRRLTMICSHGLKFQKEWDTNISQDYDAVHGLLYCGAALDGDVMKPAYTAVGKFKKSPIVVAKPLLRQAGYLRTVWADWPIVMKTSEAQYVSGYTFEEAALRLTHLSGKPIFTSSRPVAFRHNEWTNVDNYASFANEFFHAQDRLLGLVRDIASASEIITKFGSINNYNWLQHQS